MNTGWSKRSLCGRNTQAQEENEEMLKGYGQPSAVAVTWLVIMMLCAPIFATALQVGDKAPDFLLFSTIGESVRLSDYQGKKNVVLFFFVRAFGGVWGSEVLAFQLDLPKFESLDTQVLGVSVDHIGAQQAFAEKMGLGYPLLDDFSRDTVKKYGVMDTNPDSAYFRYAKRAYFIIDKQGVIRYLHIMDDIRHLLNNEEILAQVAKAAESQ
jgi:peroxiredoxin